MSRLLNLSNEILQQILEGVEAEDLVRMRCTCKDLHDYITHNRLLFRAIYLTSFDDPCRIRGSIEPEWEAELYRCVALKQLLASEDAKTKNLHFHEIIRCILYLLRNSSKDSKSSRNVKLLSRLFESQQNVDIFLCRSSLFAEGGSNTQIVSENEDDRQLSAMLHCLYGVPIDVYREDKGYTSFEWKEQSDESTSKPSQSPTHPYARSRVYDLRNYTDDTIWGPFKRNGSMEVDWEMVEALMVDLGYNIRKSRVRAEGVHFWNVFDQPFWGVSEDSSVSPRIQADPDHPPLCEELSLPLRDRDPYNVTGTWMRVVCFLDYNDLFTFNFTSDSIPESQPRDPLYKEEATRLIFLSLEVTEIEPLAEGQTLPTVHFQGVSRSLQWSTDPNANSRIKGNVRLNKEGIPHWTTISIFFGGEERWRSECVQIGGINSGRGVIGTWFDREYDVHGPAGPTAFWKTSDTPVPERRGGPSTTIYI